MTVASSYTIKVYQISGTTTIFPWGQDYDSQYGSLVVTEEKDGVVYQTFVEGTDYQIVNNNVVFNEAPSDTTHKIYIRRNTYRGQPVKFIEGEDFPAEDFEHSLDRLAMTQQEQDKAISTETSERKTADTTLQNNIDAEANTRSLADTTLQNNITAEATRASGVEGTLSNLTTTSKTNLVSAINEVDGNVDSISSTMSNYGNIVTHNVSEFATASQGAKADSAVQPADLSTVATTGSYNDLSDTPSIPDAQIQSDWSQSDNTKVDFIKNKPSIPTVNNATLTIKQGGSTKGTFTANASSDVEISLEAGGSGGADWGDIGGTLSDQEDLQNALDAKQDTLTAGSNITISSGTISATDTTYSAFTGADGINAGTSGLVPAPLATDNVKYLKGNGSFAQVAYSEVSGTPSLATVATTGAYSDLTGTPSLSGYQTTANLVTSVDSSSTDLQYPSAKLFYDTCGDIETLINAL